MKNPENPTGPDKNPLASLGRPGCSVWQVIFWGALIVVAVVLGTSLPSSSGGVTIDIPRSGLRFGIAMSSL